MSSAPPSADDQFYREYILDHCKNPRNYGRLEHPDIAHEEDNPLCGDVVGMDFRVNDGVIEDVRFHGRGCAISQASVFFFQAEDGIRDLTVTGVQTCALPI